MAFLSLVVTLTLVTWIGDVNGGIASTWDSCKCRWASWQPWSTCNRTCWGSRTRSREVWTSCHPLNFNDCASNDMGSDHDSCNSFCYNGGSADVNNVCSCADGWTGTCCDQVMTCGTPSAPTNGFVHGNSYNYADVVFYTCHSDYNISGDLESTCDGNGVWSGTIPQCIYVKTCSSTPCLNGGDCVDGLNQYTCRCKPGYSGRNCENDVQPPVFQNCSNSFTVHATSHTVTATWAVPQFSDPLGHDVVLQSSNYDVGEADFPWGDFTVQYVALKPSNGLSAECVFNISVRPTPCPPLSVSGGSALVCNGWLSDYARICQVFCKGDNSLPSGDDHRQQYVCGADGIWKPSLPLPKCTANLPRATDEAINDKYNVTDYSYSSCSDTDKMAATYLGRLGESGFKDLCHSHQDQCIKSNVDIQCR